MDVDLEPPSSYLSLLLVFLITMNVSLFLAVFALIILIVSSAMISGSEIAYFSLTPDQLHELENNVSSVNQRILSLKKQPRKLLATILISNNFVNIAIVLVSDYILSKILNHDLLTLWAEVIHKWYILNSVNIETISKAINFSIAVVGVTTILVLLGEIMPKIYANVNNLKLAKTMSSPLKILMAIFSPFSNILVKGTNLFEDKLSKNKKQSGNSSKDDIEDALDYTMKPEEQEFDLLKSIIKFSEVSVKQIMKPRNDVFAIDIEVSYDLVLQKIKESGFSRIPIYKEEFDELEGILYAKDLISHLDKDKTFKWQNLIRKNVHYIPESKKINDLLKEFQKLKLHMAIVVDEYGGNAGLITMEDIMEEILGEIFDEFDEEQESESEKINDKEYIFEGKTSLIDFVKNFNEDIDIFDDIKGDSDSLAGLILEIAGEIPEKGFEFKLGKFSFIVDSVTDRRIEKILVKINESDEESI